MSCSRFRKSRHLAARGIYRLTIAFTVLVHFAASTAAGAPTAIVAHVSLEPNVVEPGEPVTYIVSVRGVKSLSPPEISFPSGLQPFGAPSREFSFYMDNRGQHTTTSFRYRLLPTEPGEFTIGPFSWSQRGREIHIPAVRLKVVGPQGETASAPTNAAPPLFARVSISPARPYVDQWCEITIELFRRGVELTDDIQILNLPEKGIAVTPLRELTPQRRTVQGRVYDVRRFRGFARFSTAGEYRFAPAVRVQVIVPPKRRTGPGSPFGSTFFPDLADFFFEGVQTHPYVVQAPRVSIQCRSLPKEDRPRFFRGAVGDFTLDVRLSPTNVSVGDPITVTVTVSGTGNVETVTLPAYSPGKTFRVYDAKLIKKDLSPDGMWGSKIFEMVVMPTTTNVTSLPPFRFAYFDPATERYRVLQQGPFRIHVSPQIPVPDSLETGTPAAQSRRILGEDIIFIKAKPGHLLPLAWLQPPFRIRLIWVNSIPLLVLLVSCYASLRRAAMRDGVSRRERAPAAARKALKEAEKHLRREHVEEFYRLLCKAVNTYFAETLQLAPGHISPDLIIHKMQEAGIPQPILRSAREVFDRIDTIRYAPREQKIPATKADMRRDLVQIRNILIRCRRSGI
ncbi:MAG TPA: protein BatD [Kiritimatiellae bacterium]|nr:protein BatD [Kiritimatiellia bacterium]